MTSMPSYPTGPEPVGYTPPNRIATPPEVLLSVKLWFASIIVGLVGGILVFALTDQTAAMQAMADSDTGLTEDQLQAAVTIGLVIALVLAVILLALQVFFVLKMKAGRNWARIVLAVLGGLSIVSALPGLADFSAGTAVNLISVLLLIAAIVFMFRPAANPYFSQPKA